MATAVSTTPLHDTQDSIGLFTETRQQHADRALLEFRRTREAPAPIERTPALIIAAALFATTEPLHRQRALEAAQSFAASTPCTATAAAVAMMRVALGL